MKAFSEFSPWLGVFETLRVVDGIPLFEAEHAIELRRAMDALGLKVDANFIADRAKLAATSGRWRWVVTAQNATSLFTEEAPLPLDAPRLVVSPVRVGSNNWDARFKTISYLTHAQAAEVAGNAEAVLLNENSHVASTARANIFWRCGQQLFTPAHEAGCRCGVVRDFVLKKMHVEVGHFPLANLLEADEIFTTNSLRGIVSMSAVEGRTFKDFSCAEILRRIYADTVTSFVKENQNDRPCER